MTSFTPTRRDKRKITIAATWVSYVMSDQLHPYKKGQEEDNNSSHMGELWMSDQLCSCKTGQEEDNNSSHMGELCDECPASPLQEGTRGR